MADALITCLFSSMRFLSTGSAEIRVRVTWLVGESESAVTEAVISRGQDSCDEVRVRVIDRMTISATLACGCICRFSFEMSVECEC